MFDYSKCMNRMIFCIDLCSFFASCACVMRGLDPLKVKLAVVGDLNRKGLIVLAATPELTKFGVSTATKLYEITKDPNIIIMNATMRRFVEISNQITEIYTKYVALEDLHVYSIDECFLDMQQTAYLFGRDPFVKNVMDASKNFSKIAFKKPVKNSSFFFVMNNCLKANSIHKCINFVDVSFFSLSCYSLVYLSSLSLFVFCRYL